MDLRHKDEGQKDNRTKKNIVSGTKFNTYGICVVYAELVLNLLSFGPFS